MPDARLERTRRTYAASPLSSGAGQTGDILVIPGCTTDDADDRAVQAAIDENRVAWGVTANVIEGDHH